MTVDDSRQVIKQIYPSCRDRALAPAMIQDTPEIAAASFNVFRITSMPAGPSGATKKRLLTQH